MISKTFSAATQYSAPVFLEQNKTMAVSLSGAFVGTVQLQRLMKDETDKDYPAASDSAWAVVSSYTAPVENQVANGDGCWYRAYCSAYTSGSPVVKLMV
jgi:hypothetical protein